MKKAIIFFIFLTSFFVAYKAGESRCKVIRIDRTRLLSPLELQEELVKRGYNIKCDDKVGPLTIEAWRQETDKQYIADSAAKAMGNWNGNRQNN